jgi:hypothetical protein
MYGAWLAVRFADRDDGQPDLPDGGGHAGLPGGSQCDYLVWLRSEAEARA